MQRKRHTCLVVDPDKCVGCHSCEMACSIKNFSACSPLLSRIRIQEFREVNTFIPVVCQACEEAICLEVCPQSARVRLDSGAMVTDETKCIGCNMCVYSCPFGACVVNPRSGKTMTCDQCDDDPQGPWCVRACTMQGALTHRDTQHAARGRSREYAKLWKDEFKPPSATDEDEDDDFGFSFGKNKLLAGDDDGA